MHVCTHMGEFWDSIPNTDFEPSKSKWLALGKLEELTHKSNSNCHECVTQSLSLSFSQSLPVCLPTRTIFLFLLINTLLVSLLFIFMGIFFYRAEGPGPCHWPLVERLGFGALTTRTQPHLWLGNRSPASSCTGRGHPRSLQWSCSKLRNFRKNQESNIQNIHSMHILFP